MDFDALIKKEGMPTTEFKALRPMEKWAKDYGAEGIVQAPQRILKNLHGYECYTMRAQYKEIETTCAFVFIRPEGSDQVFCVSAGPGGAGLLGEMEAVNDWIEAHSNGETYADSGISANCDFDTFVAAVNSGFYVRNIAVGEIEMRKKTEASDVVISHLSWQGEDILDAGDISASNWSVSRVDYDLVEGADMSMSRIEAGSKTILADMSLNTAFEIVPQLLDQEPVAFDMYADDLSEFDLSSAQAPQVVEDDFDLNFELPDDLPIFQQENNGQMAFVM